MLNHKIWRLAWPMIISSISVPLLGLVDTAILGHLENARYLAAVAVGSTLLSFLYWGFGFLRMGTTGLTAQAMGGRQNDEVRLIFSQAMILGVLLGLGVLCLSPLLLSVGFRWVVPPEGTAQLASQYAQIRIFSAPAVLLNYAVIGWLIGRQNTRWPLLITLFTNGLNVIFDCLLILGLGMKSEGAAIASLIAEFGGCGLGLLVVRRQLAGSAGQLPKARLYRWQDYRKLLLVNRHLFIRTLVLLASIAFFTAQGAKQGETLLAANTILMSLLMLTSFGLDGFAHAAEALVGHAVGQRNRSLFMLTCRQCALWSLITAMLCTLFYLLLGEWLVNVMTSIPAVQQLAYQYLPWLVLLPIVAVWSYLLDGIFIGATQTRAMQSSMLFSAGLVYLPCWYFSLHWGNHGLWFAFIALNAARSVSLLIIFWRYTQQQRWC